MIVKNDREFQDKVCERDGYICQHCKKTFNYSAYFDGERNQYVAAHHLKKKRARPDLRFETDNGICLCKECHLKAHS